MTMTYDPLAYEMPWRPNYEMSAVLAGWLHPSGRWRSSKLRICRRNRSIG